MKPGRGFGVRAVPVADSGSFGIFPVALPFDGTNDSRSRHHFSLELPLVRYTLYGNLFKERLRPFRERR
jgi:hypothetical protein